MDIEQEEQKKIVGELQALNIKMDKQMAIHRIFFTGIIYGIGFFIGSVIIASIAFGVLSPFFGKIDWIRDNFERGASFVE